MKTKTPGYNTRLRIAFTADKNGRPVAYYWSGYGYPGMRGAGRWIRMSLAEARMHVAQGDADQAPYLTGSGTGNDPNRRMKMKKRGKSLARRRDAKFVPMGESKKGDYVRFQLSLRDTLTHHITGQVMVTGQVKRVKKDGTRTVQVRGGTPENNAYLYSVALGEDEEIWVDVAPPGRDPAYRGGTKHDADYVIVYFNPKSGGFQVTRPYALEVTAIQEAINLSSRLTGVEMNVARRTGTRVIEIGRAKNGRFRYVPPSGGIRS